MLKYVNYKKNGKIREGYLENIFYEKMTSWEEFYGIKKLED